MPKKIHESKWFEYISAFFILAIVALFFYNIIIFSKSAGFQYDIKDIHYPWMYFNAQELKEGRIPLWNPYYQGGEPQLANIQTASLYPLNILSYFTYQGHGISYKFVELNLILHYLIGAFFFYALLRIAFKLNKFSSISGSIVYLLSGFMVAHAQHFSSIESMAWTPLILLIYLACVNNEIKLFKKKTNFIALSIAFAMQILAGQTQIFYYTVLFLCFYAFFEIMILLKKKNGKPNLRNLSHFILPILLPVTMAFFLTAFQLIPMFEYLGNVNRQNFSYTDTLSSSLNIPNLLSLLVPFWTGGHNLSQTWLPHDFTEAYFYLGIFPIIVIFFAFFSDTRKKIFSNPLFWVFSLFFLMSLGPLTPIHKIFYSIIPYYSKLRRTVNFFWFVNLGLVLLFAMGLENIQLFFFKGKTKLISKFLFSFGAFLLLCFPVAISTYFLYPQGRQVILSQEILSFFISISFFLLILLFFLLKTETKYVQFLLKGFLLLAIITDLFLFSYKQAFNFSAFNVKTYLTPNIIQDRKPVLPEKMGEPSNRERYRVAIFPESWHGLAYTHAPSVLRFQNTLGYYNMYLDSYSKYLDKTFSENDFLKYFMENYSDISIAKININLLSLLDIKYLAVGEKTYSENVQAFTNEKLKPEEGYFSAEHEDRYKIIEVVNYMPKVYVVSNYKLIDNIDESIEFASENTPGKIIAIDKDPGFASFKDGFQSDASVKYFKSDSIKIAARSDQDGVLVLSETYYPGWKVYVDGIEKPILRVDGILRGAAIPKGAHTVEFVFRPNSFITGIIISICAMISLLSYSIFLFIKKRRP